MISAQEQDFASQRKYEQDQYDTGIHCTALRELFRSVGHELVSYKHNTTRDEDYKGIDGYAMFKNLKEYKVRALSTDFKIRSFDKGDLLLNIITKHRTVGWALNPDKKNDILVTIWQPTRKACLVFREDMINAEKFLKSKTLIPAPDGQKNIAVSFDECKENFPRFIGPVYF